MNMYGIWWNETEGNVNGQAATTWTGEGTPRRAAPSARSGSDAACRATCPPVRNKQSQQHAILYFWTYYTVLYISCAMCTTVYCTRSSLTPRPYTSIHVIYCILYIVRRELHVYDILILLATGSRSTSRERTSIYCTRIGLLTLIVHYTVHTVQYASPTSSFKNHRIYS